MTSLEYQRWVVAAALAAVRLGAAFAICPALSDAMISGMARRCAVLGFAAILIPMVLDGMPPGAPYTPMLVPIVVKEALIGLAIGFFASVPFWIAENIGNVIDNQRGATMGEVYSPLSGTQVSTTGIFFTQIVSTIFFVSGAVFLLLGAVYSSYSVWPVFGAFASPAHGADGYVLGAVDGMMRTTLVISAPILIIMFLATLGLGFVNRTAPQLNVFFLSMPIKSALGIGMLVIYLPFIIDKLMYTKESDILVPVMKVFGN